MPLSAELQDAVNHVLSHAQGLRAILTIAEKVEEFAMLEQQAAEAEARMKAAEKAVEKAKASIEEIAEMRRQAALEQDQAKQATVSSKHHVKALHEATKKEIASTIAAAKEQAKSITLEAEQVLAKARAGLDEEIEAKKVDLATLDDGIKVKMAEAEELEKRIAKAKAYLGKLVETT